MFSICIYIMLFLFQNSEQETDSDEDYGKDIVSFVFLVLCEISTFYIIMIP